jgi:MOSC domain-containing protein YiiM
MTTRGLFPQTVKPFLASHRSGFYLRVLREGEAGAGDEIALAHADENRVSVLNALRLYVHESDSSELLRRALQVEYLPAVWREEFSQNI